MLSVRTTPEEFKKTQQSAIILDLRLSRTRSGKSHDYHTASFSKNSCYVFRPHENEKPAFSNSSGLKGVFEKFVFRDGSVWTVGKAMF